MDSCRDAAEGEESIVDERDGDELWVVREGGGEKRLGDIGDIGDTNCDVLGAMLGFVRVDVEILDWSEVVRERTESPAE
jgi:hypothetical protein